MQRRDVLVATWAGGGNLPPLLSVAQLLAGRGCAVRVLTSRATQKAAEAGGLHVVPYTRSPQPDMTVAFESQAAEFMAVMAGPEIASEVRENLNQLEPQLLVADCMLPAALAAGRATGTPTASVVHFLYGAARADRQRVGMDHRLPTAQPHPNRPWTAGPRSSNRGVGGARPGACDRTTVVRPPC